MADRQDLPQARSSIKQHIANLETILIGSSSFSLTPLPANTTPIPTPPCKKSKHKAPTILSAMKVARAGKEAAEAEAAAKRVSLSALIETSIHQIEALLTWETPPRGHQPSSIVTAFHDYHELREQQKARLEEYKRRARLLKMKLELAKIAASAMEKGVRGLRGEVEGLQYNG